MIALPFIHTIDSRSFDFEDITLEQLQQMLQTNKGARIITLVTVTEPNLKQSRLYVKDAYDEGQIIINPYYNNCVKVSRINGIVNWHYANAVNNQLRKEGKEATFIPDERKWGTRLNNSPFVSHVNKEGKNRLYLEVKIQSSLGTRYYNPSTGLLIDQKDIEPWLKEKKSSKEHQGVEKEIILRDYLVNNIATIVIDGAGFFIKENIQ